MDFMKDNNDVHYMSSDDGEFTLCGYAFDAFSSGNMDEDVGEMKATSSKTVTCPDCVRMIERIKKVKTKHI